MTPIILNKEVDCILQNGIKYCQRGDIDLRTAAIIATGFCLWMSLLGYFFIKDDDERTYRYKIALGITFFAPFILMIIFG